MSNLVPFAQAAVPAFFAGAFSPDESNITSVVPLPALSFRGKAWRISLEGQETLITNKEGEPSSTVSVIVLDQIKKRSRGFYEGQYVAGENKPPRCSSVDGVTPDADVKEPCAATCASCPNSVKGSKVTPAGKAVTACGVTKRLAVIPASKTAFAALLLRLAQTSLWDKENKENEDKGWYAWDRYMDFLKARGVTHTAQVVTKMKFDHRTEYPKLLFTADRWVTPEEWAVVGERWKSEEVKDLLLGKQAGATTTDDEEDDGYTVAPAAAAPAAQPAAAAAPAAAPAPARTRRARPEAAAPAPAPAPAAALVDDDEEGEFIEPAAAAQPAPAPQQQAPAPAAAVQAAPATANAGLSSLLGSWDD